MSTRTMRSGLIVVAAAAATFLAAPSAFADPPPTHAGGGATGATTGGSVTVAKPAGGGGSAGAKSKCDELREVLNQDLQDLGWAQASGHKDSAAVAGDYAQTDLRAGESMGCGWAK